MHSIRISTVALLAALVISTPAAALSVKLLGKDAPVKVTTNDGGGVKASVNTGSKDTSVSVKTNSSPTSAVKATVDTPATKGTTATVNVNTGSSKGNTVDAKVNTPLNNNKTNANASVDVDDITNGNDGDNTPVNVNIGNSGSGSKPASVKVTGSPLNSSTTKATVSTGSLLPDTTGGLVDDGTTNGSVTLGGSGSNAVDSLFGGNTNGKVDLKIGKTIPLGTTTPVVGKTGALPSTANVALNAAPSSVLNGTATDPMGGLDVGKVVSGVADVNLLQDLFGGTITLADAGGGAGNGTGTGTGTGTGDNGTGDGGTGGSGTGDNGTGDNGGSGTDDGGNSGTAGNGDDGTGGGFPGAPILIGGNGGSGSDGSNGDGSTGGTTDGGSTSGSTGDTADGGSTGVTGTSGTGVTGGVTTGGTQVASLDGSVGKSCFTPNGSQTRNLLTRHPYNADDLAYFGNAKNLQVVSVGLCGEAATQVSAAAAASDSVSGLQSFIAKSPTLSGALAQQNHQANDVVAVDRKGDTLMVYVL